MFTLIKGIKWHVESSFFELYLFKQHPKSSQSHVIEMFSLYQSQCVLLSDICEARSLITEREIDLLIIRALCSVLKPDRLDKDKICSFENQSQEQRYVRKIT